MEGSPFRVSAPRYQIPTGKSKPVNSTLNVEEAQLFEEISTTLTIRNKARSKETLQLVVINLWLSYQTALPVKYSRNRRSYQHHRRYGKLHIRYKRLIPIIDELERREYLIQKLGFYDKAKRFGRRTRMVPATKLIRLFQERIPTCTEVVQRTPPEQIVQLKNADKILVDYPDTRSVRDMRVRLRRYNEFISEQSVEVVIPEDVEINLRFLVNLKMAILKGVVSVQDVDFIDGPPIDSMDTLVKHHYDIMTSADGQHDHVTPGLLNDLLVISSVNPVIYTDVVHNICTYPYSTYMYYTYSDTLLLKPYIYHD